MTAETQTIPIIRTKLYRPPVPADLLHRERLQAKLELGRDLPMTLVSAPAGYGKSTLVSHWLETCDTPSVWLSLDESDSDTSVFLHYVIAALQTSFPDACPNLQVLLGSEELAPPSVLAGYLSNDLDAISDPFILALDDYHCIREPAIHSLLALLLKHPPPSLRVVIISRRDPPLSLAALRARHSVSEIRMQDLQFTQRETAAFLERASGYSVGDSALAHLKTTMEGWAVGLRLTSLALQQRRGNAEELLSGFKGELPHIQDYLLEEILEGQSPAAHDCLCRRSILDRFCGSLSRALCDSKCDPSTCGFESQEYNHLIEGTGLLCIVLDDQREWYRYHHLFQELLRQHLGTHLTPKEIAALHRRASGWFEEHDLLDEALQHALKADDVALAGKIIVRRRRDLLDLEQWHWLERWLGRLPSETVESDSELLLIRAWLLENRHRVEEIWPVLDRAEALVTGASVAAETADRVSGEIHAIRSRQPYEIGDGQLTVQHAEKALRLLPRDCRSERGYALVMLSTGHQMSGNLAEAQRVIHEALASEEASNGHFHGRMLISLCFVCWMAADLHALKRTAARLLRLGEEQGLPESIGFGRYFLGIAHYQHNELASVEQVMAPLVSDQAIARTNDFVNSAFVMASMCEALGRGEEARGTVDCIVELMLEKRHPVLLPVAQAYQADLALRQGRLSLAARWAQHFDPEPLTAMYLAYIPAFTLARVLLAENTEKSLSRLGCLLDRLADFVSRTHNRRFEIDVRALRALTLQQQGNEDQASEELIKAVRLAQPGGFIRAFVDLGPSMARLLNRLELDEEGLRYVGYILSAFKDESTSESPTVPTSTIESGFANPLSKRELDVLALLAQRLSNKEIAGRLHISPETVKRHANTIYEKLDVHSRREAVAKATGLGVFPRG